MNHYDSRFAISSRRTLRTAATLLALGGCAAAAKGTGPQDRRGVVAAAGTAASAPSPPVVIAETAVCAADNPFCSSTPLITSTAPAGTTPLVPTDCGNVPIDLRPAGVNIMIAVDGSAAMDTHWTDIGTAIRSLRENNPNASFGAHLFWADPVDPQTDTNNRNSSNNACKEVHNKLLELGSHTAADLVSFFGSAPPGGALRPPPEAAAFAPPGFYQVSPLIEPLNTYLEGATALSDPKRTNYLVVFTSGNDNCFGAAFNNNTQKLNAYEKLAVELSRHDIRLIPVGLESPQAAEESRQENTMGFMPPPGVAINGIVPTDYVVLDSLLKNGGAGLSEVPRIDTPAKLAELVSVVGQTVNNCRFELPTALDANASVNPFEVSFTINNITVARDRQRLNGWDFVNDSTSTVEFFGQGCQAVQAGQMLQAKKSCAQDICATAAVSIGTKPRAVQMLLDSSASRIECQDSSFDCFSPPGTEGRVPTFWEVVMSAVESALVSPVNADVMFGMQFFPSKNSEAFACDVAAAPEIAPEPSTQISIMRAMLEKLPFGLSPVVGVMESVAAAPGSLVDPGVVGAVVLLSDGGDNCSGVEQAQIVSRLGAAAKKLSDAGVKTYAIRYGSTAGETADQAAQLDAITMNGGTAQTTGATAYIDAKTPEELTASLAEISDKLATCSFVIGGIGPDVDKDRTNLFLNGAQIGQDAMLTRTDGWNWVDAERTTVELFGEACKTFKSSRRARLALEFGCTPIVVPSPD
jgi:hypothetical protein